MCARDLLKLCTNAARACKFLDFPGGDPKDKKRYQQNCQKGRGIADIFLLVHYRKRKADDKNANCQDDRCSHDQPPTARKYLPRVFHLSNPDLQHISD